MDEGRLKTRCRFSDGLMLFSDIHRVSANGGFYACIR